METRENQSEARQDSRLRARAGLRLLILQHPRESKRPGGTAHWIAEKYPLTHIQKGLAWPNLKRAWSRDPGDTLPTGRNWGVLFMGGRADSARVGDDPGVFEFGQGGKIRRLDPAERFEGIVLIDGNWKEAKTLWWRNPWLLRLKRLVVVQEPASGVRLRRAANKTGLSTAECAAYCLKYLGGDAELSKVLLEQYQQAAAKGATSEVRAPSRPPSSEPPPTNLPY